MTSIREEFCEFIKNNKNDNDFHEKRIAYNKKLCNARYLGNDGKRIYKSFVDNNFHVTKKIVKDALSLKNISERYILCVILRNKCVVREDYMNYVISDKKNLKLINELGKWFGGEHNGNT